MKSLCAFVNKEAKEHIRSGKLMILGIVFVLFGIMNPAVAKLTPWMMEIFADALADSGLIVTDVTVSALDSWVQFFKNMPMALIAFVLVESSIFTKEYSSGTLIMTLTKGLSRYKVVVAKALYMVALWTVGYFLCFAITYAYNSYFWDNSIAENLVFSVLCWWVFGIWMILAEVMYSIIAKSSVGVLLGCGVTVLLPYVVGLLPKVGKYMPTHLLNGNSLIYNAAEPHDYIVSIVITVTLCIAFIALSIPLFNRKQM